METNGAVENSLIGIILSTIGQCPVGVHSIVEVFNHSAPQKCTTDLPQQRKLVTRFLLYLPHFIIPLFHKLASYLGMYLVMTA